MTVFQHNIESATFETEKNELKIESLKVGFCDKDLSKHKVQAILSVFSAVSTYSSVPVADLFVFQILLGLALHIES